MTFGPRVALQYLSTLNKSQVAIELALEKQLVSGAVRPVQMIADRKGHHAGQPVSADDVDHIFLFYRHATISRIHRTPGRRP
jgi:hypothetical protein